MSVLRTWISLLWDWLKRAWGFSRTLHLQPDAGLAYPLTIIFNLASWVSLPDLAIGLLGESARDWFPRPFHTFLIACVYHWAVKFYFILDWAFTKEHVTPVCIVLSELILWEHTLYCIKEKLAVHARRYHPIFNLDGTGLF